MTAPCARSRELTRLLDGELTENRAAALRAHLGTCGACATELETLRQIVARVSAPVPDVPPDGALAAVMGRLASEDAPPRRRPGVARLALALGGLAAASAVAVVAVILLPHEARDRGEFSPRGAPMDWSRKVGIELWALEAGPRRLSPGDRLAPGVPLVGSFSNVDAAPAYLLAFALDGRGEVHWLYPAFMDPRGDPASIRLDASVVQRALPDSVVLEDVAPGGLRFVFVVTREPLRVSSVEAAAVRERTPEALRARWPGARVDELRVTFGSPPPTP